MPGEDTRYEIQTKIHTAASRAQRAALLIDEVIDTGRNPKEDPALKLTCESVEGLMKDAIHLIHTYKEPGA